MSSFNSTFGFLRAQCPSPTIATASGGSLTAGSAWIGIVRQNRVGFDVPAALQQITWTTGQKVVITLPSTLRVDDSEDLHRVWVIVAASNTVSQSQQITCWRGYQLTQIGSSGYYAESRNSLPATIELTQDSQLTLGATVANPAALLALTNLLDGAHIFVTSLNGWFYYDPVSTRTTDNLNVLDASPSGKWLKRPFSDTFSVGSITDTTGDKGANRDTRSLLDADVLLPPPRYRMDNTNSAWVQYTMFNGYSETGTAIDGGTRLMLDIYQSGAIKSQLFSNRVLFKLLGVVRFSDGTLSTAGITANVETPFDYGTQIYTLEQDLQPGYGLSFAIAFRFDRAELDGDVQTGVLAIRPYFSKQSGAPFSAYPLTGDLIFNSDQLRRVYPRRGAIARVGAGAGAVKWQSFLKPSSLDLTIPTPSVTDQKITINGNGDIFWRGSAALLASEVTRAVVGLRTGRSNASPWTSYSAYLATDSIQVTVTYPTTIRSNYPDVIAGAGSSVGAKFNAPFVVLYIQRQSNSEIREFINNATLDQATQTFTVSSFSAGTVISSLPSTVGDFGLWEATSAPTPAALPGGGSLTADSYRVAYAFRYDGSTLTDISHSTTVGCVPEFNNSLGAIGAQLAIIQAVVDTLQNGSGSLDALNATIRGTLEARGALNFWADLLTLNQDATQTGADWRYGIQRPPTGMTANQTLTFPAGNGKAGQALIGDGAGALSYGGVYRIAMYTLNFDAIATNATQTFTVISGLPPTTLLLRTVVHIIIAFNGTSPSLQAGHDAAGGILFSWTPGPLLSATADTLFEIPGPHQISYIANPTMALTLSYSRSTATTGKAIVYFHYYVL